MPTSWRLRAACGRTCETSATIEEEIAVQMASTGLKLLWGTANLFSHPRYAAGAATNPDPEVFAYAAAQVRCCMETTYRLGGENYVLWGGREGYDTLLNTDLPREVDHYARFLTMVVEHKHRIGFKGAILLEPKPFEPTKHQYDRDVATVYAFLQRYGLENEVKVNIEVNHATLAGLDFEHEVAAARMYGILGSLDINRGDPRSGWDTDQFPNNAQDLVPAMLQLIENGGLGTGGFNFDAKLRRQSIDPADLYLAHIGGIDTLARALLAAADIVEAGGLKRLRDERYEGWSTDLGRAHRGGRVSRWAIWPTTPTRIVLTQSRARAGRNSPKRSWLVIADTERQPLSAGGVMKSWFVADDSLSAAEGGLELDVRLPVVPIAPPLGARLGATSPSMAAPIDHRGHHRQAERAGAQAERAAGTVAGVLVRPRLGLPADTLAER